jgi:hypothetical protein
MKRTLEELGKAEHEPRMHRMNGSLSAIILAGRIRPSPWREALDVHVLCLPVGLRGSLMDAWLEALGKLGGIGDVQVVVNTPEDVESVTATAGMHHRQSVNGLSPRVLAEPAAWRGAAGILRDVTSQLADDDLVLVCEGKLLPPPSLSPILEAFHEHGPDVAGVVGVCGKDEPAGVYVFTRKAIGLIPHIGYFDMKEQFLPALRREGHRIVTARLGDAVWRLRDLESYLATVRQSLSGTDVARSFVRASDRASISGSAVLDGFCVIEPGAVVEDGAVVHDSVVLWGATIGGGAVVSRSVVGPLATIEPRSRLVRSFVARPMPSRGGKARVASRSALERPSW